ncbi:MAG TPA: protein translocase subunit SecF [bacterium]|nr:protein translocase subunit SecF [bacterium]
MQNKVRFDIVGKKLVWLIISLSVIGVGIASLAVRNLNYGVDFTGGRVLWFEAGKDIKTDDVEKVMAPFNIIHNPVQILSGGREFMVKTEDFADEEKAEALAEKIANLLIAFNVELYDIDPENFQLLMLDEKLKKSELDEVLSAAGFSVDNVGMTGLEEVPSKEEGGPTKYNITLKFKGVDTEEKQKELAYALYKGFRGYRPFLKEDKVDPIFGIELKKNAAWALIIATLGILIYVTIRFEFWYAVAAIIALIHDTLVTLGFYSLLQLEVNSAFVAIILTVFGYSINDTIVIFDRIRENVRKDKKAPLDRVINVSLWETMPRSINTVLTTEIAIIAILILGGQSIKDFVLGLSIGIASGCYSSILVAAPLAFVFKTFDKHFGTETGPQAAGKARKATKPSERSKTKVAKKAEPAPRATAGAKDSADMPEAGSGPAVSSGGKKKKKGSGKQRRR